MATSEELFISISPQAYRQGKASVLMSQAELLHSLKRLQNLKVLARQKKDLRERFHSLLESIIKQVNSLQSKMPTPAVPKTILRREEPKPEPKPKEKKVFSKRDEIEEELMLIQAKLRELNA